MTKQCWRCKRDLPVEAFGFRADPSKGRRASCLECEDPDGVKRCRTCENIKPKSEFHRASKGPKGSPLRWLQSDCKACQSAGMRAYHLKSKYGISLEDYEYLLMNQHYRCAICSYLPESDEVLHVDHNHATGNVRGLLCTQCNTAIGSLGDDPRRLRNAALYLENNEVTGHWNVWLAQPDCKPRTIPEWNGPVAC